MTEENNAGQGIPPEQQPGGSPAPIPAAQPTQPAPQPPMPAEGASQAAFTQPVMPPQPTAPNPQYAAPQQPTQGMPVGYQTQPGQQVPAGYGYQQPYGAPQQNAPTGPGSGKALGALICGICAIVFSAIPFVGIILGIIAIVLASQYVKAFGKEGKATGGKVTGVIGIVFSIIALIIYIASFALVAAAINEYNSDPYSYSYSSSDSSSPNMSDSATDADEKGANDAAKAVFDELKNPSDAVITELATNLDEGFVSTSGLQSLSDIGVDPKDFSRWLLSDFAYELDGAYTYSDGTGTVYADVTTKDYYEFMSIFSDNIDTFVQSDEAANLADQAAVNAKMGELITAAMDATPTTASYVSVEVVKSGDTWTVDEKSMEDLAQSIFGVF